MSASNETSPPGLAKWLAGVLIGSVFSTLGWLGNSAVSHERRLSAVETRQVDDRQYWERLERKLDRVLSRKED